MNVCAYLGPMGVFVSSPFLGALKSSDPAEIAGAIRWNHGGSRCAASLCLGPEMETKHGKKTGKIYG